MSATGLLLGVINIAAVVVLFLLVGAILEWIARFIGLTIDSIVRRLYIALVALIAVYMLVRLMLGVPVVHWLGDG